MKTRKHGEVPMRRYLLSVVAVFLATSAAAAPVLDQQTTGSSGNGTFIETSATFFQELAQTFTVGLAGELVQVNVALGISGSRTNLGTLTLHLREGDGTNFPSGPDLATVSVAASTFPNFSSATPFASFDLSTFDVDVDLGDFLAVVLTHDASGDVTWEHDAGNADYLGGTGIFRNSNGGQALTVDFRFQTFVEPAVVPEPGTLTLLSAGLVGIGWVRRRRGAA
jgi:hypothetical protein